MSSLSLGQVGGCGAVATGVVWGGGCLIGAVCTPVVVVAGAASLAVLGISYAFPPPGQHRVDNRNLQQAAANDEAAKAVAGAAQEAADRCQDLKNQMETLANQLIKTNEELLVLKRKYDDKKIDNEKLALELLKVSKEKEDLKNKYNNLKIKSCKISKTLIANQKPPKQEQRDRRVSGAAQDALATKAG